MPFSIRPFRRFPVQCPVSYNAGSFQGQGTLWNFSVNGWKLSGDVPLQVGQRCSLTVTLPDQPSFFVSVAIVRWTRGQEYGLETLAIDKQVHSQLEHVIHRLEQESGRGETEVKANTNTRDPGVPRPCLLERERGRAPPCGSVSGQC